MVGLSAWVVLLDSNMGLLYFVYRWTNSYISPTPRVNFRAYKGPTVDGSANIPRLRIL